MRYFLGIAVAGLMMSFNSTAQNDSIAEKTLPKKTIFKSTVLPGALILTGATMTGTLTDKTFQRNIRNKVGNDYHNGMDDYIQYVPFAQVYIGDVVGLTAKNHWFDQTKNMAISGVATTIIVHSFKRLVGKDRPDGSSNHSFPSGHTATSFTGATLLFQEFKDNHLGYAMSGYLFSTATGSLRVMNNRHWVADVIAGAGVGILVVNLVYLIEPLKNWNPFKENTNLSFTPMISDDELTFVAVLKF